MSLSNNFYFSQSSLQTYKTCPLKFRLRYIDGLYWPVECESALKLSSEIGKTFHLVAQRYFLGISPLFSGDELGIMMREWYKNLASQFPLEGTWIPEISLKLNRQPLRLTATYDVIHIPGDGTILIYDWKTGQKPPSWNTLRHALQTVVYRYLMVEAGETVVGRPISPEDVTVIYWNPRFPTSRVILRYSEKDYHQDESILKELVSEIINNEYRDFKPAADPKTCLKCEYRMTCKGREPEGKEEDEAGELEIVDWDDAPEIAY